MRIKSSFLSRIYCKLSDIKLTAKRKFEILIYKLKYSDYIDDQYNCGDLKWIWSDTPESGLYGMSTIEIIYDRKTKMYSLGIETAFLFNGRADEARYLREQLEKFTDYMEQNHYSTNEEYSIFFERPFISLEAESIEELYTQFRIFVEGFCELYEMKDGNKSK